MLEFHQKYGSVVRLAPDELTYTTATALKEIYGNRGGKKPMPPQFSLGTHEKKMFGATSFIWLESHQEHYHHRKILAQGFSDASLKAQEPIVMGHAALMMQRLRERAARGEVVDMWAWFNYFTFVSHVTFFDISPALLMRHKPFSRLGPIRPSLYLSEQVADCQCHRTSLAT